MGDAPLYQFTSHIAGKNAIVQVWPDRIEWEKPRGVSAGKLTAGLMTGGASLLATGVKNGKRETEMIPLRSIHSVTTKRDGLINSYVSVITSGNEINFRVSHREAETVKATLTSLISGTHALQVAGQNDMVQPPPAVPAPPTPAAPSVDVAAQLQQLASLRDAGILTEEEFGAKKAEILARL